MKNDLLTSVFERLRSRLQSLAHNITGSKDDAEDAVHDAFCRLWASYSDINDDDSARCLSFRAVYSASVDHVRRRNVRRTCQLSDDMAEDLSSDPASPDTHQIWLAVVDLAKSHLSDRQFEIFSLRDIEGLSFSEIAEITGSSQEAVRVSLSRSRKTIRELYKKLHYE